MALVSCDFFSDVLGLSMSMTVIVPQGTTRQIGMTGRASAPPRTLYLLHGMSDDHTVWLRRTSIERYVADRGLAVVMPAVHKSRYSNLSTGDRYWDYVAEEVPALCRQFFGLFGKREDTYVAGLSMGGYGAWKLALNYPHRFSAAASLSGSIYTNWDKGAERPRSFELAFESKDEFFGSENDLVSLAQDLSASGDLLPRMYQCCGTADRLYDNNQRFRSIMEGLRFDYTYEEEPGDHEWGYWDVKIRDVLEWIDASKE